MLWEIWHIEWQIVYVVHVCTFCILSMILFSTMNLNKIPLFSVFRCFVQFQSKIFEAENFRTFFYINWQLVCQTIWNDDWSNKRRDISLCHNAQCHLDQTEDWIFCVLLAMGTSNIKPLCPHLLKRHFKHSVDTYANYQVLE